MASQELPSKDVTSNTQRAKVLVKCAECAKAFSKACELEQHMEEHRKPKDFKCETCGKEFFLEWRFKKHRNTYVENKAECPFERIV